MADLFQIDINVKSNADQAARGLDRLEGSVVNNLKTVERLERNYKLLDKAFNTGKITSQRYAQGVAQVDRAIDEVMRSTNQAAAATNQFSNSINRAADNMNQYGRVSALGGKNLNRTNMVIQQAGYQFQDFAVQIQGGTNAFVALGQQGSQLLGLFGAKGAVLGAILAIGTAFANVSTSGKQLAVDFKQFGRDMASAFSPLMPVFSAIGTAFKYVSNLAIDAINFIINGIAKLVTALTYLPSIISEVFDRGWTYMQIFGNNVAILVNEIKFNFTMGLSSIAQDFAKFASSTAETLNRLFNLNLPTDIGSGMVDSLNEDLAILNDNYGNLVTNNDKLKASVDGPIKSFEELKAALDGVQDIDIRNYFKLVAKATKDAGKEAKKLRDELEGPLVSAVESVSNAFGDFIARGLTDFKGFVKSILASFQNMISQMIAMAVKNRIMLSLGIGGVTPAAAAAGQVAGLGTASTMLGSIGTGTGLAGIAGGTGFLGGAANTISGLAGGGAGIFNVGANAAAAGGGIMATVGAAMPLIGVGLALFSLFKKKPIIKPEDLAKVNDALDMTGQKLELAGKEAQLAAKEIGQLAGGFDQLSSKASFFFENFYSDNERQTMVVTKAQKELDKVFNELGISVPQTRDAYRSLVEAQDLSTEAGRKMYAALLNASQAFIAVQGSAQEAANSVTAQREASDREAEYQQKLKTRMQNALTGRGDVTDAIAEQIAGMSFYERAAAVNEAFGDIYVKLLADIESKGQFFEDILVDLRGLNTSFEAGSMGLERFLREVSDFSVKIKDGFTDLAETTLRVSTDIGASAGGFTYSTETLKAFISGTTSRTAGATEAMSQQFLQGGAGISPEITQTYKFFTDLNNFVAGPVQKAIQGLGENFRTLSSNLSELKDAERMASEAIKIANEGGQVLTEQQIGYYNDLVNNIGLTQEAAQVALAEMQRLKEVSVVIPEQAASLEAAIIANLSGGVVDTGRMIKLVATYGEGLGKQIALALANAANAGISGVMSAFGQFGSLYSAGAITTSQYKSLTDEITSFLKSSGGGGGGGGGESVVDNFADSLRDFVSSVEDSIEALKNLSAEEKLLGGSRIREVAYLKSINEINKTNLDQIKKSIDAVKDIDKEDYASRFEYMREVGRTINLLRSLETKTGLSSSTIQSLQKPDVPVSAVPAADAKQADVATATEVRQLRTEMKTALTSIAKFTRKSAETLNKFDYDGMPDSRGF